MPLVALAIALLMVSRIPYPHLVTHLVRGQKSFPQLVAIVFVLMAVITAAAYAIPALCGFYALAPPLVYGWRWYGRRRRHLAQKAG